MFTLILLNWPNNGIFLCVMINSSHFLVEQRQILVTKYLHSKYLGLQDMLHLSVNQTNYSRFFWQVRIVFPFLYPLNRHYQEKTWVMKETQNKLYKSAQIAIRSVYFRLKKGHFHNHLFQARLEKAKEWAMIFRCSKCTFLRWKTYFILRNFNQTTH